jgi:hypothetical protein
VFIYHAPTPLSYDNLHIASITKLDYDLLLNIDNRNFNNPITITNLALSIKLRLYYHLSVVLYRHLQEDGYGVV